MVSMAPLVILLLAYLAIGLIAVTITVHTISLSYCAPERILPNTLFSISLIFSAMTILEVLFLEISVIFSIVFVVLGLACMIKTLNAAEKAVLEIPKPEYEV